MIDLIVNENGGITVAHDLRGLDALDVLEISMSSGRVTMHGDAVSVPLGILAGPMMEMVHPGMDARSVRVSGWSLARVTPLSLRIH